jgi:hypothetical protein
MAETIGLIIVDAILEATGSAAVVAFAESSFLGISGASLIGAAAILGTAIGLQYLLGQPSGSSLPKASSGSQPLRQPLPPHTYAYGRCRIAGVYTLFEARNGFSYNVQALHKGQIRQFVTFYLHDDEVHFDPITGFVTSAVGTGDSRYSTLAEPAAGGNPIVILAWRRGLPRETAYDRPLVAMPDIWTPAHRGDGIASVMMVAGTVKSEHFSAAYPQGLPQVSAVADWLPIWDPRKPGQDPDNVDALDVSYNPVIQAIDFITDNVHGLGFDREQCIAPVLDALMAEAAICEESIPLKSGGTEPRYQSSGFWNSQVDPAAVLDGIMSTCDGWYSFNGDGTLSLTVGKYREPRVTLPQRHIVGFSVDSGVEDENAINCLQWSFTDPLNKYRDAPGDAWLDEEDIAERAQPRSQTVQLSWVQSHAQGRRLMKRKMAQANPRRRGTLTTDFYGIHALGERWIRVQDDRHVDLADAVIQLGKVTIDIASQQLTFEWISVNTNSIDAWDPQTEEGNQPSTGIDNPGDTLPVPQNLAGSATGTSIRLTFDDPGRVDLSYVVQFRIGAGAFQQVQAGSGTAAGGTITLVVPGFSAGQNYELQVASQRTTNVLSAWSASVFVHT